MAAASLLHVGQEGNSGGPKTPKLVITFLFTPQESGCGESIRLGGRGGGASDLAGIVDAKTKAVRTA